MRTTITLALAALVIPVGIGCGATGVFGVGGSGRVTTEERDVSGFDQVSLSGIGDLRIQQGDSEALTIEAEDNIIPNIQTEVSNGRLTIRVKPGISSIRPTKPIIYHLTVKTLHAIDLSGSGDLDVTSLESDRLSVTVSGAGTANLGQLRLHDLSFKISGTGKSTVAGTTTTQTVDISGAGQYQAPDLASTTTTVTVSGAGNARVRASDALNVRISGAGSVSYYGNPRINQSISGAGSVRKAGD